MRDIDLLTLSKLAISAAELAGEFIENSRGEHLKVETKCGGSTLASQVVTEVDLQSQKIILDILTPSCEDYDIAMLAEEDIDSKLRLVKDFFWCVDPLDGTLPFIEGSSGYSVSIALVSKLGEPLIGVIYDPNTSTLYHAVKGEGAYRNNQQWILPQPKMDNPLTLVCDRSFIQHRFYSTTIDTLNSIASTLGYNSVEIIKHGGAAMNACWVLENTPACYIKYPKLADGGGSLWDYAASACLFNEIGATATDIHGNALLLNNSESTFMNKRGVLYASCIKLHKVLLASLKV